MRLGRLESAGEHRQQGAVLLLHGDPSGVLDAQHEFAPEDFALVVGDIHEDFEIRTERFWIFNPELIHHMPEIVREPMGGWNEICLRPRAGVADDDILVVRVGADGCLLGREGFLAHAHNDFQGLWVWAPGVVVSCTLEGVYCDIFES